MTVVIVQHWRRVWINRHCSYLWPRQKIIEDLWRVTQTIMPAVCVLNIPGCDYVTDDLDAAIVAALITAHCTTHAPGPVKIAKVVGKMKRPVTSTAGTSEEWVYFESRWSDYIEATNIAGRDTKMGQNWRHHRSPPMWSVWSKCWWFGKSYFTQQNMYPSRASKQQRLYRITFSVRMYLPHQPLTPNKLQNQLRIH